MGSKGLYERVYKGSNGSKDRVEKVSRVLGRGWIMISDSNNSQGNIYIKCQHKITWNQYQNWRENMYQTKNNLDLQL